MHGQPPTVITCHSKYLLRRCKQRDYLLEEVMPCVIAQDGDMWTIDTEHPAYPMVPRESSGPGTELKKLLESIGIKASPTCKCNKTAKKMDKWGPEESLLHIEEIVDVMEATAKTRKLPFIRAVGRKLVQLACWRARRKANR